MRHPTPEACPICENHLVAAQDHSGFRPPTWFALCQNCTDQEPDHGEDEKAAIEARNEGSAS